MIFLFRRYFYNLKLKLSNIGWLFTFSILLTIGIGMLYTFNITVFFVLVFSISISYFYAIAHAVSGISFQSHHIAVLSFIIALFMFIFGLIVQNHIEFAQAINIPENVLALSARQALMKEMASVSAVLIILTGVLFYTEGNGNMNHSIFSIMQTGNFFLFFSVIVLLQSSCKNNTSSSGIAAIISEYQIFQDTLSGMQKKNGHLKLTVSVALRRKSILNLLNLSIN